MITLNNNELGIIIIFDNTISYDVGTYVSKFIHNNNCISYFSLVIHNIRYTFFSTERNIKI